LKWEFERDGRPINIRPPGSLVTNEASLALAAVRAGAVLGYFLEDQVQDDLAAGRLVQVLAEWCPTFPGCHLYPSKPTTDAVSIEGFDRSPSGRIIWNRSAALGQRQLSATLSRRAVLTVVSREARRRTLFRQILQ
jgi:hypothetical protein